MNKIDELIGQALTEEDRALLASHGEPGFISQTFGLFRGPMAWVMWVSYIATAVAFFGGAYAMWQMFDTADVLVAVKWGALALFLFQVTTMCKIFMGTRLEANRLLREIKRMELQVSLLGDRSDRVS